MNDNPAEQSSSTEQRTEALGKTEHPQNRALGRAGAVMGKRRDEQTAAATGRAFCEDEPSGRRGREPRWGLRVEAARIGRIRDGRMTVTGGADGSSGRPRARESAAAREEEPQRAAPEEAATGGASGDPRGRQPGGARSAARGRRLRDGQTGGWPRKASATDGRPRGWKPAAADGDGADGADG